MTASARRASRAPSARRLLLLPESSIILVTLGAAAFFAVTSKEFLTGDNAKTLLPFFAPFAILAAGEVLLMVSGEIDLSIGSVSLFSPFMVYELDRGGLPLLLCLLIALLCCAFIGLINGLIVEVIGVSSFVTTLGTLLGVGGLTLIISGAAPVTMPGSEITSKLVQVPHVVNGQTVTLPERINEIGTFAKIFGGGTYSQLVWALLIVGGVQLTLSLTRWGRHAIAVGGNRLAAAQVGISVRRTVIANFIVCSTAAGFVGVLEAVRTTSVTPDTAGSSETMFRALSAAVIGGTLLAGGAGTAVGAFFGALFLGVLRDGLTLEGLDADYLDFILGLAILAAMALHQSVSRLRTRQPR